MQAILSILLSWCTATRQFLGKLGTADCGFCVMHTVVQGWIINCQTNFVGRWEYDSPMHNIKRHVWTLKQLYHNHFDGAVTSMRG